MPTPIPLPKLGNSVESSIVAAWLKQPGDIVAEGDVVCTVETDKTTMEVVSPASGVLLKHVAAVGDDVPVHAVLALLGAPGESLDDAPTPPAASATIVASPRARALAAERGGDLAGVRGSGPGGRIIERDVLDAPTSSAAATPADDDLRMTPVARAMVASGEFVAPKSGSGPGGTVTKSDLQPAAARAAPPAPAAVAADAAGASTPLSGVRRVIAQRMRESLQSTAQLTMHTFADARALQALRARFKDSAPALGLRDVTIGDLLLFVTARALLLHPELNATFDGKAIFTRANVDLAFAVDTDRGLLVPVIPGADALSLKALANAAHDLTARARGGRIDAASLTGGSVTVTNLGASGIESFTPILNPPQVAILGIGAVHLKPIEENGAVAFVPHIGLSLTIDHQVVDGGPAARFLKTMTEMVRDVDLVIVGSDSK
jgi:pyruvate dehydrogenase E2 component (dihydrolipoamide acetyltransferase)